MKRLLHHKHARHPYKPVFTGSEFPLSSRGIAAIHDASMEVLSRTGVRFVSENACSIFRKHGFRVDAQLVRFSERQIEHALETVPRSFTIVARNPEHNIHIEPGISSFGMGRGAVNMVLMDGSIRRGTLEDVIASSKLCQMMDELEHWGPLVYPTDVEPDNVYLAAWEVMAKYVDKPYLYAGRGHIDFVAMLHGTTREQMASRSDFTRSFGQSTAIVQSPLTLFAEDCEDLIEYARCGIACNVASMPVAGTTGPCTLSGLVVQQNLSLIHI